MTDRACRRGPIRIEGRLILIVVIGFCLAGPVACLGPAAEPSKPASAEGEKTAEAPKTVDAEATNKPVSAESTKAPSAEPAKPVDAEAAKPATTADSAKAPSAEPAKPASAEPAKTTGEETAKPTDAAPAKAPSDSPSRSEGAKAEGARDADQAEEVEEEPPRPSRKFGRSRSGEGGPPGKPGEWPGFPFGWPPGAPGEGQTGAPGPGQMGAPGEGPPQPRWGSGRSRPDGGGPPGQPGKLRFNFRFQPWMDVLNWFAQQADLSLICDAPPVGTFNYTDSREYTPAEAIDLLNGVLLTKGFTLVRRDRMLMVINLKDGVPPNLVSLVPAEELDKRGEYELVSVLFSLEKLSPEEAEQEVQKLLGPQGSVVVLPRSRHIQVTETAGRLRTIRRVIETLERPQQGQGGQVKIFPLKYVSAEEAGNVLRQLLDIPAGKNASTDGSIRFMADTAGRRIMATGKPDKLARISEVLEALDVAGPGASFQTSELEASPQLEVYPVVGVSPESAFQVLQTLLTGMPDVRLTLDAKSGNLVALARPSQHATIRATLEQFQRDARRVEVIPLQFVEPQAAVLAITKLFSSGPDVGATAPTVDADPNSRQLFVRASEAQLQQIKSLLGKMGETSLGDSGRADRGNVRVLPLTGRAARSVLERALEKWPAVRANRIQVVTPAASIPSVRPSASAEEAPGGDARSAPETPWHQPLAPNASIDDRPFAPRWPNRPEGVPDGMPAGELNKPAPQHSTTEQPAAPPPGSSPSGPSTAPQAVPPAPAKIPAADKPAVPKSAQSPAAPESHSAGLFRFAVQVREKTAVEQPKPAQPAPAAPAEQTAKAPEAKPAAEPAKAPAPSVAQPKPAQPAPAAPAEQTAKAPEAKPAAEPAKAPAPSVAQPKPAQEAPLVAPRPPQASEPSPIIVSVGPGGLTIASQDIEALNAFEQLLTTLASSRVSSGREMTVFYLKYAQAAVVAETLDQIFAGGFGGGPLGGGSLGGGSLGGGPPGSRPSLGGAAGGALGSLLGSSGLAPSGPVLITPDSRLNALIVKANPSDVDTVEELLKVLDQKASPEDNVADAKPRLIPVFNTQASEVAQVVREVYQDRLSGTASMAGMSPMAAGMMMAMRQQQMQQQQSPDMQRGSRRGRRGQGAAEQPKMSISVDARTNSLIVSAPEALFEDVKQLVEQLDQGATDSNQVLRVVTLQRSSPTAVQQALTSLMGSSVQVGRSSTAGSGGGPGSGTSGSRRFFGGFGSPFGGGFGSPFGGGFGSPFGGGFGQSTQPAFFGSQGYGQRGSGAAGSGRSGYPSGQWRSQRPAGQSGGGSQRGPGR